MLVGSYNVLSVTFYKVTLPTLHGLVRGSNLDMETMRMNFCTHKKACKYNCTCAVYSPDLQIQQMYFHELTKVASGEFLQDT